MCKAFAPDQELHIDPADASAVKGKSLVYCVVGSADHDCEGHFECGRRMKEITSALEANKLTAEANPAQVPCLVHVLGHPVLCRTLPPNLLPAMCNLFRLIVICWHPGPPARL
jgi:hypothetical protein